MHIVNLRNDWYDPNGKYRKLTDNPHEVEESLFEFIPSTATVDGKPPAERGNKALTKTQKFEVKEDKAELEAREAALVEAKRLKDEDAEKKNKLVKL